MSPELKHRIQLVLVFAMLVAGIRVVYVFYSRRSGKVETEQKAAPPLNADYYVIPKKLYPYDLKSAKQLTQQPVWVKEGYRYAFYRYETARKQVDFVHDAGQLLPIEKLEIKDIVTAKPAGAEQRQQVMAVFQKEGKTYAVPIGFEADQQYKIY